MRGFSKLREPESIDYPLGQYLFRRLAEWVQHTKHVTKLLRSHRFTLGPASYTSEVIGYIFINPMRRGHS